MSRLCRRCNMRRATIDSVLYSLIDCRIQCKDALIGETRMNFPEVESSHQHADRSLIGFLHPTWLPNLATLWVLAGSSTQQQNVMLGCTSPCSARSKQFLDMLVCILNPSGILQDLFAHSSIKLSPEDLVLRNVCFARLSGPNDRIHANRTCGRLRFDHKIRSLREHQSTWSMNPMET